MKRWHEATNEDDDNTIEDTRKQYIQCNKWGHNLDKDFNSAERKRF